MELKQFISKVMYELKELKKDPLKSGYLVDELEFELSLTEIEGGEIRVGIFGVSGGVDVGTQNTNKVKVKLTPKNK